MQHATVLPIPEADYLAGEPLSAVRHEYVAGHVYAMAGAGKAHNTIALNIASRLRNHLRGSPCRSYIADMKVRVAREQAYFYPDVVVTCSERDTAADAPKDYLTEPRLIVEVLSPGTETTDRREKMRAYAALESLREYVLVESRFPQVEVYRRLPDGGWEQWTWSPGETVRLDSVGLDLAFAEIYEDVEF
ncbi:Uma2 family endonuclease [Methylococcus sp. EFPC2]|uniref:Uma2 family endonuclease n=1 Tax=Methylococcus sp. EFPC2 TaxID=2812648 RepID=UPI0019678307|nr:Uma2 family endonuclease [Methylococcus sp. EFPC2]QSA96797.1 Uma2 family endonuclease [Methylococcus sp. EFPC2]